MLRTLHLTLDYPPKSHGGISTAVGAVVQLLNERVGPALVISYDDWRPSQQGKAPLRYREMVLFGAYKVCRRPERLQRLSLLSPLPG